MRRLRPGPALLVVLWLGSPPLAACAGELLVGAAASLSDAFRVVATAFEADHPGERVVLSLAASGVIAAQLEQGAPLDVVASADPATIHRLAAAGHVPPGGSVVFATNQLVLIATATGADFLRGLGDLPDPGLRWLALGSPEYVPAGRYGRAALVRAGLWESLEPRLLLGHSVRHVLEYVVRGEAEAGLVFATDARSPAAAGVRLVCFAPLEDPPRYLAAASAAGRRPAVAARFVAYLLEPEAQRTLRNLGFGPPPGKTAAARARFGGQG